MGLTILAPNQEIKTIPQESCQCGYCGRTNKAELDNCKGCGADVVVTPFYLITYDINNMSTKAAQKFIDKTKCNLRGTMSTGPK